MSMLLFTPLISSQLIFTLFLLGCSFRCLSVFCNPFGKTLYLPVYKRLSFGSSESLWSWNMWIAARQWPIVKSDHFIVCLMIWCSHLSPQDPGSVIFCVWLLFTAAGQYNMQTYKSAIWTIFEVEWNPSYLSLSSSFWEDCWRNLNITLWVLSVTVGRNVPIYSFSRHFWCLILTPCPDIWATKTMGFSNFL